MCTNTAWPEQDFFFYKKNGFNKKKSFPFRMAIKCVCIYVCMGMAMCIHRCICTSVCTSMHVFVHRYAYTGVCIGMCACVQRCLYRCVCMQVFRQVT